MNVNDGSKQATVSNGDGSTPTFTTMLTGNAKQAPGAAQAPDGSFYLSLTDGSGNAV